MDWCNFERLPEKEQGRVVPGKNFFFRKGIFTCCKDYNMNKIYDIYKTYKAEAFFAN